MKCYSFFGRLGRYRMLFFSCLMFMFWMTGVSSAANKPEMINLENGWSYAVGSYKPEQDASVKWIALDDLSQMPVREQNKETPIVTYKMVLPEVQCKDCVLALPGYTRAYEVYYDGEFLKKAGPGISFQSLDAGKPDWFLSFPDNPSGKTLYLTANMSHRSSPLYLPLYYGEREAIILKKFDEEQTQMVISILILLTGLISTMLYFSLRKDQAFLYLGLCAFNIGVYMISGTQFMNYVTDTPALWDMTEYLSLYVMPITVWMYFRNFVSANPLFERGLLGVNGVFLAWIAVELVAGNQPFEYVGEQRILFLISVLGIITVMIRSAVKGNREARTVVITFLITSLITMSKLLLMILNVESNALTSYAGGFFMLSQLFVMTGRFRRLNEELSIHTKNLERFNEIMEEEVKNRTRQVRTLLDHVAQGFLTVRPDLIIEKEHSAACVQLLGESPADKNIIDVIAGNDQALKTWLPRMFRDMFQAHDQHMIDLYMQLMPTEIQRNGKTLGLSLQVIRHEGEKPERMILMVNDLTSQRALENKLKNEEKLMRMIVTVLSRSRDYQELVTDYLQFVNEDWQQLLATATETNGADQMALRVVHTFKGNFAQMNSFVLAPHLHEIENNIRLAHGETIQQWKTRVKEFEWLKPFDEEQARMFDVLPQSNWNSQKDAIPVPRETLIALREHILESLPETVSHDLVKEVERLYQRSFASLFETVAENSSQLAERLNKLVEPVQIEGGEQFVDLDPWYDWSKSLVHITRNQLDHGIESPDDRIEMGKPVAGKISIIISEEHGVLSIRFSDDGAGINAEKLRNKLISSGVISPEQAAALSDEQLYPFLFMDAVSTKDTVTELSGRGVGLAKVLEETQKIGGTIHIESSLGSGTTFHFRIPVKNGIPAAIQTQFTKSA